MLLRFGAVDGDYGDYYDDAAAVSDGGYAGYWGDADNNIGDDG